MHTKLKIFISTLLILLFSANINNSIADDRLLGTFDNIYPASFLETKTGKASLIVGSAIVVGTITYFTAGTGTAASAGPIATWVGTKIGMLSGLSGIAATNSGLAILGGGAVANGGLGVLGGISVLNALGDLALAFAIEKSSESIDKPYEKYTMLKLKIPKRGNKEVRKIIDKLNDKIELFNELQVDPGVFRLTANKYHRDALKILMHINDSKETAGYDYLLKAVLEFNMMKYHEASQTLFKCDSYFKNPSVIYYMRSLLSLVNGDYDNAKINVSSAIAIDEEAILPYILYVQILIDTNNFELANAIAEAGLSKADDENFTLSLLAGNINYFELKRYENAIEHYRNALSNISVNEFESECKLMIAKSYRKLGDTKIAQKWLQKALSEVNDNPPYRRQITENWIGER
jgi:tetratricopeptide (TPR) repeat protein